MDIILMDNGRNMETREWCRKSLATQDIKGSRESRDIRESKRAGMVID